MPDLSDSSSPSAKTPKASPLPRGKAEALHPKDTVETAGDRMRQLEAPAWPVAEDCKLVGMIDVENPDWNAAGHGHDPRVSKVAEMMTRQVLFCREDATCEDARRMMDENGIKHLPVVDRDMKIVGIFRRDEIDGRDTAPLLEKGRTAVQKKSDEETASDTDPSSAD